MKKMRIALLFLITLFILTACSLEGSDNTSLSGNAEKADARLVQVLEFIQNQDDDNLQDIFSKQALSDNDNFNDGIVYLFDFFHGEVKSWERDRFTFDALKENGETSIKLIAWYTVETTDDKYMIFMTDYTINTINADNEGLYALRVIKAEDEDTQFTYWQDMDVPGIYVPEE